MVKHLDHIYYCSYSLILVTKAIYDKGYIEIYQCEQYPETFRNCDYVFCFIGEEGNSATFLGCY